jgi:sulfur transfer complex TusBCD TusB component (DsrH family)
MKLSKDEGNHNAENNQGVQLLPNDVLLLCSDGLTDLVWDDEILEVIRAKPGLKEAARALIELANARGGHDNTTVVLISVPSNFKLVVRDSPDWLPWIIGGAAGMVFVLVAASFLTFNLLRRNTNLTLTPTASPTSLPTLTPLLQPTATATLLSTATSVANTPLPVAPTYTPWPTNTVIP